MNRVLAVGGFPNPIGGVTSFIYRLADNNLVSSVADLYPSDNKLIPDGYKGKFLAFRGFFHFLLSFIFFKRMVEEIDLVHFNFSRPVSLIFPFLLPKRGRVFVLMLHHGELDSPYPVFLTKLFLNRFDKVYSLSSSQENFYEKHGYLGENIIHTNSYIPSSIPLRKNVDSMVLDCIEKEREGFCVVSGSCSTIYNHHWVVDLYTNFYMDEALFVFLYGSFDKEYFEVLQEKAAGNPKIRFFTDVDSNSFNYALSKSKYYLRPNAKDSFGIAVADAVSYGVPVLASNVCSRYSGAYLFNLSSYQSFVKDYFKFIKTPSDLKVASDNGVRSFTYTSEADQ